MKMRRAMIKSFLVAFDSFSNFEFLKAFYVVCQEGDNIQRVRV